MPGDPSSPGADASASASNEQQALLGALQAVLWPLARLAVARGLPYAAMEEVLKQVIVRAAAEAHPGLAPQRSVSRIATATGIHRREVTRLVQAPAQAPVARGRSLANEVFTRWLSDKAYGDDKGRPLPLRRLGPAPSFESLSHTVTRDVHPRSLLDELLRLKLAALDETSDIVTVRQDGFVPSGDLARMLGFLAGNIGDHLSAGVENVLADGRRHFEQAVFADDLSDESLESMRPLITAQWKGLLQALVPELEKRVQADEALAPAQRRRIRIGLYAYDEPTAEARAAGHPSTTQAPAAPRRRLRKT
jgi:hypothetical protein